MATVYETSDSNINAYASGSYTIGFDDVFAGTFGGGDAQDGINLPTLEAGTTYTITMTVDDISGHHAMGIINRSNFHSLGVNIADGEVIGEYPITNTFVTVSNPTVVGNTITMDVTPMFTQSYSLFMQGEASHTDNYTLSITPTPIPPVYTPGEDSVIGTSGDDIAGLLDGDDTYAGGEGNDTVSGDNGHDVILGEGGADWLNGNAGDDSIDGGAGDDMLIGSGGVDSIFGGAGKDTLDGGNDDDELHGGDDNDLLLGAKGNDMMYGDAGDDTFKGGMGNDTMDGGAGADVFLVEADAGDDRIVNFEDNVDRIDVSGIGIYDHTQLNKTDDGTDTTIDFGNGTKMVIEGMLATDIDNADLILDVNPFVATVANDTLHGSDVNDQMSGGDGDDRLFGENGNDVLNGDAGRDDLRGGMGNDSLYGGDDNDKLQGQAGDDFLSGGAQNDNLQGGAGNDWLEGGTHNDRLDGGDDNDMLLGQDGNDNLMGGNGDDTLDGGNGRDQMTGGAGADVFVFATGTNRDTITDFEDGIDQIDLTGLAPSGITEFAHLAISDNGVDAVVMLDNGNYVTLLNTLAADLDATDFIF